MGNHLVRITCYRTVGCPIVRTLVRPRGDPGRPQGGTTMAKDRYEIGRIPPPGVVPPKMYAQVIRPERFGEPKDAFQTEVIDTPSPGPGEALVLVMAAGINYNNVWAAKGVPLDVTKAHGRLGEPDDFHIGGCGEVGGGCAVGGGGTVS